MSGTAGRRRNIEIGAGAYCPACQRAMWGLAVASATPVVEGAAAAAAGGTVARNIAGCPRRCCWEHAFPRQCRKSDPGRLPN